METMDDILKEPEQKPEVEEVEKQEVEKESDSTVEKVVSRRKQHLSREYDAQGRDPETGQFVSTEKVEKVEKVEKKEPEAKQETKTEATPKVEMTDKEKAFLRAAEEERRKRQALEAELAQFRQQKQPEGEKKTFWDDPEGHLKTFEQRMAQKEQAITLQVSERIARSKYQDFDDKIGEFAESLRNTPGLHAQWLASPDPAEFAYRHGAMRKEMREVGDIEQYKAKIEKELRAKLESEFRKKQEDTEKQRQELPGTLSDVRGASKKSAPVWTGPTSFDDILKP